MLIIVSNRNRSVLRKYFSYRWAHIGRSANAFDIESILDPEKKYCLGREIEKTADKVRENFIDYIGKLSNFQDDRLLWYSSYVASKSSSQTNIFSHYVYSALLKDLSLHASEDLVIVCDDELIEALSRLRIGVFSGSILLLRIRILGRWIAWGLRRFIRYAVLWAVSRRFKTQNVGGFNVILHSWIDDRAFKRLPHYQDEYFGPLENFLTECHYAVGRIASCDLGVRMVRRCRKNFSNIIFPLAYLNFFNFIQSFSSKFRIVLKNKEIKGVSDLDILNVLMQQEIVKENLTCAYAENLLKFYSYRNLEPVINPQAVIIYPFENQPWEKMLNLAFTRFKKIAYQNSTVAANWLDYRVSRFETQMPLPRTILNDGPAWLNVLCQNYPSSIVENVGALRFSYLFESPSRVSSEVSVRKDIVVVLPIFSSMAIRLQKKILELLRKGMLENYSVIIKPHPFLDQHSYLVNQISQYKNVRFVQDSISALLQNCSLLIACDSTVSFEALFSGVKTLVFVPDELTSGLEGFLRKSAIMAYEDDFSDKFQKVLTATDLPRLNREDFFLKPDLMLFEKYLKTV